MLKLLREHELAPEFRRMKRTAKEAVIAVPFWGRGAIKLLGLDGNQKTRVICNLGTSACNPYVIADLKKLKGVSVRTHPRLHAKIYATSEFGMVGSSNASTNGLALEGHAVKGWIEANVLSNDPAFVQDALGMFEDLWRSDETLNITPTALFDAQIAWDNRPKRYGTPIAQTLLATCREKPELFSHVFVAVYDERLDPNAEKRLKAVHKEAAPTVNASDFKRAWGYQYTQKFYAGSQLVDLDCINPSKCKMSGYARVPTPALRLRVKDECDMTLAVRQGNIRLQEGSLQLRLSSAEKNALEANGPRLLKLAGDELLPLIEAVHVIDKATRKKA